LLRGSVTIVVTTMLLVTMGAAALSDLRTRRIPNWLTLGGLCAALVLRALTGVHPLLDGLAGAGLGFGLGIVCVGLGALGGGDGKLLMAAGAFLGFEKFVGALLLIGVLGGLLGIAEAVHQRAILPAAYNAGGMLKRWATFGRSGPPARSLESPGAVKVPYGVAIALGAVAWWFWGVPIL
jgi:prepilin peptidase CpaA